MTRAQSDIPIFSAGKQQLFKTVSLHGKCHVAAAALARVFTALMYIEAESKDQAECPAHLHYLYDLQRFSPWWCKSERKTKCHDDFYLGKRWCNREKSCNTRHHCVYQTSPSKRVFVHVAAQCIRIGQQQQHASFHYFRVTKLLQAIKAEK